jgi:hypothetical protein
MKLHSQPGGGGHEGQKSSMPGVEIYSFGR